jgi:hypothetical protein
MPDKVVVPPLGGVVPPPGGVVPPPGGVVLPPVGVVLPPVGVVSLPLGVVLPLVDAVCVLELPELPEPQPVWVKVKENNAATIPIRNINLAIRYMSPHQEELFRLQELGIEYGSSELYFELTILVGILHK